MTQDEIETLTTAAWFASSAAADMLQAVHENRIAVVDHIGAGRTHEMLAESLRLLYRVTDDVDHSLYEALELAMAQPDGEGGTG